MSPLDNWMLRSDVFVSTSLVVTTFIVHFWYNGDVVIYDLNRPTRMESTDDDVRVFYEWCKIGDWKNLKIHDRLVADKAGFDYWYRIYRAGLVDNDQLRKCEELETSRLNQTIKEEEVEDNWDVV